MIYHTNIIEPYRCIGFKKFLLGVLEVVNHFSLWSVYYFKVVHSVHFPDQCTQFVSPTKKCLVKYIEYIKLFMSLTEVAYLTEILVHNIKHGSS